MTIEFGRIKLSKEEQTKHYQSLMKDLNYLLSERKNLKRNIAAAKKEYERENGKGKFEFDHINILKKHVKDEEKRKSRLSDKAVCLSVVRLSESEESSQVIADLMNEVIEMEEMLRDSFKDELPKTYLWSKLFLMNDTMNNSYEIANILSQIEMYKIAKKENEEGRAGEFGLKFNEEMKKLGFETK